MLRAKLVPIIGDKDGTAVAVQFNPTTLNLQYKSHTGQKDKGVTLARQYLGLRTVTLTVDLIFDTADTAEDVRDLTRPVISFFSPPKAKGGKAGPPRVRFEWGTVEVTGTVESATEDLEMFSPDGKPLRAKVHLSIEGQEKAAREAVTSPADGTDADRTPLGGPVRPDLDQDPGTPAGQQPVRDRSGPALAGESAPAFAARAGLDPRAWRSLDLGGQDPMALTPGVRIAFPRDAAPPARSVAGFAADDPATPAAGGAVSSNTSRDNATPSRATGSAARGAGGAAQAAERRRQAGNQEVVASARADFGLAPLTSPEPSSRPAGLPPLVDQRSLTYGYGVPLRSHFGADRVSDRADRFWVAFAEKRRWLADERRRREALG